MYLNVYRNTDPALIYCTAYMYAIIDLLHLDPVTSSLYLNVMDLNVLLTLVLLQ